jgi:hypothetical protein
MASVTEIAEAVLAVLDAGLEDVDFVSSTTYMPALQTANIALMGTPRGHSDEGYFYSAGWLQATHRLRFEFWVKLVQGQEALYQARARDIGYEAMRVLVAHHGEGYVLQSAQGGIVLASSVEERAVVAGGLPYLVVSLIVPIMQKEAV